MMNTFILILNTFYGESFTTLIFSNFESGKALEFYPVLP